MKEEQVIAHLGHSYFNRLFKDTEPFLEYFDKSLTHFNGLKTIVDSDILERIFFMACFHTKNMDLPFNYIPPVASQSGAVSKSPIDIKNWKKEDWLTDVTHFGSKSKQGVVVKSLMFGQFHVVIKKARSSRFDTITLRDFCVGISINKILDEAPFFVRTLGCYTIPAPFGRKLGMPSLSDGAPLTLHTSSKNVIRNKLDSSSLTRYSRGFHIVTEFVDGISLKSFIKNKKSDFTGFLNIFFQILLGLETAQHRLNFSHYDLHTDNVILVHQLQTVEITLHGYTYRSSYMYRPVMIDFGLSTVFSNGETVGQTSLESKGIYSHLSPGYDVYIFLLFCADVAQKCNKVIADGIAQLLHFFKLETNVPMQLLLNNHVKALQKGVSNLIPIKFINYLLNEYSGKLNVEVVAKRYNCLGCRAPVFVKLKQLFDVNDELDVRLKTCERDGLMKVLTANIKTYYWLGVKNVLSEDDIDRLLEVDRCILSDLLDDLNIRFTESTLAKVKGEMRNVSERVTVNQKNIFFVGLDYYLLILELELQNEYNFYKWWLKEFRNTFVFKNVFNQLNDILVRERLKRCPKTSGGQRPIK
jgi:serine/threonine protein kinase